MNVGSLFSGIGGMDHGLHRAGFHHVFFCESDEWRRTVLAHHWPGVPIWNDVRDVAAGDQQRPDETLGQQHAFAADGRGESVGVRPVGKPERGTTVDGGGAPADGGGWETGAGLLCGGFPCQDLSVAGQRRGLNGDRSGLFFEFARIIESLRPRWVLLENVPGLLSSNDGRDFGIVLGTLADIGYGVGYRVLDSRFFGVPQRRRRVFILGALADNDPRVAAERAGAVLAVGARCPGHPPTGTEKGPDTAVASLSGLGTGGPDDNDGQAGRVIPVAETLREHPRPGSNSNGQLVTGFHQTQDPITEADGSPALGTTSNGMGVGVGVGVRRLTPIECERLQALPDNWTQHGLDSRRYAALGDAVTSSVAEWIGRRILAA